MVNSGNRGKLVSESNIDSLNNIRLLAELDNSEQAVVEKSCRWKAYDASEQIIDQHSDSRDIFFVVEGRVRVVNYSLSGREITFDDLDAGSHFGELAAIDGLPRSASVMALDNARIASLPAEQFQEIILGHPSIALKLMKHLAHLVRTSTSRIMDLSTLGANNRIHADLLRMARKVSSDGGSASISPIPVHSDIASRVSTTRETVARVMNDLARKGIVERQKDSLLINSVDTLEEMVEDVRGE
ncbi:MAG: Crp/Fnr family transcriptional regulator [Rhodospirillaceae bacterium]|nr:Crp/Fnr family transcriptional regulator [Rhodospirillaceae bacterium]